jgi:hypothetical protein
VQRTRVENPSPDPLAAALTVVTGRPGGKVTRRRAISLVGGCTLAALRGISAIDV